MKLETCRLGIPSQLILLYPILEKHSIFIISQWFLPVSYSQLKWKWQVKVLVAQSCLTLCDPVDCSLQTPPFRGILQASTLQRVAIPLSRGSSWPRDWTWSPTLQGDSLLSEPLEAGVKIKFGIVTNQPVVSTFAEADGASSVFTDNF